MIHPRSARRRGGFTLIEMLVVLGIIVLLASLTIGAVVYFSNTGPRTATRSNLASIKAKLDNQWKAVRDAAQKETIPPTQLITLMTIVKTTQPNDPGIKQKYILFRLTQAFPQNFTEAFNPGFACFGKNGNNLPAWNAYVNYLKDMGVNSNNANTIPQATQNAICLMMILERGPQNTGVTPDSLGTSAAVPLSFTAGKQQQQAYGCVDAWGNPLSFKRDLTRLPQPLGNVPQGQALQSPLIVATDPTQSPESLSTDDGTAL